MNEIVILKGTLEVIPDASKWTKGEFARSLDGRSVGSNDPDAYSFCLISAVLVAGLRLGMPRMDRLMAKAALRETIDSRTSEKLAIVQYNDAEGRTYEEIRSLIEETIERLEKSETA